MVAIVIFWYVQKVMTKADKFRITGQNKLKMTKDMLEGDEDTKNLKPTTDKSKNTGHLSKQIETTSKPTPAGSKKRTTTAAAAGLGTTKASKMHDREAKKKADIYEAMKGVGFGVPQPKIATNKARAYKY